MDEGTAEAEDSSDTNGGDADDGDDVSAGGDDADDQTDEGAAVDPEAEDPEERAAGNAITVAGDQADDLDPTTARTAAASAILDTVCYALYAFDFDAELQPQLASDLPETSEDGLTVTIPLRDDVV